MENKLSYSKEKLRPIILELASLNGYENPLTYLNDLLERVKSFNDENFIIEFYLNVHYLCKEYSAKFWNEHHKKLITDWLKESPIMSFEVDGIPPFYDTTWNNEYKSQFAEYLKHNKPVELAQKLIPFIKKGKGKHVALCITALIELDKLNFTNRQPVYDSLGLNYSQYTGANDYFNVNSNSTLDEKDIQNYKSDIQSIIDNL